MYSATFFIALDLGKVFLAQVRGDNYCWVVWAVTITFPALQSMTAVKKAFTGTGRTGGYVAVGLNEVFISIGVEPLGPCGLYWPFGARRGPGQFGNDCGMSLLKKSTAWASMYSIEFVCGSSGGMPTPKKNTMVLALAPCSSRFRRLAQLS